MGNSNSNSEQPQPFVEKQCPISGEICRTLSMLVVRTTLSSKRAELILERIDNTSEAFKDCDKDNCGVAENLDSLKKYYYL